MIKNTLIRNLHRLIGALVVIPLILWMVTGLLFHIKHRYSEAYESLEVSSSQLKWDQVRFSPAQLIALGALEAKNISLHTHPTGRIVYFGWKNGQPVAIDGSTGNSMDPVSLEVGREWALKAVSQSSYKNRYGAVLDVNESSHHSSKTGASHPAAVVNFSGGKRVTVNLLTGEVQQRGSLNQWIDFTYRLHYLQWFPWKGVNIAFVLMMTLLIMVLALSGITLGVQYYLKR